MSKRGLCSFNIRYSIHQGSFQGDYGWKKYGKVFFSLRTLVETIFLSGAKHTHPRLCIAFIHERKQQTPPSFFSSPRYQSVSSSWLLSDDFKIKLFSFLPCFSRRRGGEAWWSRRKRVSISYMQTSFREENN